MACSTIVHAADRSITLGPTVLATQSDGMASIDLVLLWRQGGCAMSRSFWRQYALIMLPIVLVIAISFAVAGAATGTVTGPTPGGAGLQWEVTNTVMQGNEDNICLSSWPGACTCVSGDCPLGPADWLCSMPLPTCFCQIGWEILAGTGSSCANGSSMAQGTYGTNVVTLRALSAQGSPVAFGLILSVAGFAIVGGVALRRARRS